MLCFLLWLASSPWSCQQAPWLHPSQRNKQVFNAPCWLKMNDIKQLQVFKDVWKKSAWSTDQQMLLMLALAPSHNIKFTNNIIIVYGWQFPGKEDHNRCQPIQFKTIWVFRDVWIWNTWNPLTCVSLIDLEPIDLNL